jgi:hypothetical protein
LSSKGRGLIRLDIPAILAACRNDAAALDVAWMYDDHDRLHLAK